MDVLKLRDAILKALTAYELESGRLTREDAAMLMAVDIILALG